MIEQIISEVIARNRAACGQGWLEDARHYFCEHEAWHKASAFERTDEHCVLELKSTVSPALSSLGELRSIQQKIWLEMAFSYFEASSVIFYKEASVLRFVTLANKTSTCLTGRMIVAEGTTFDTQECSSRDCRKQSRCGGAGANGQIW